MKKNLFIIALTTFLLMFVSVAYAAFSREVIITGDGLVEKDTVVPTCGSWYLRDSNLTIQEAYDQDKFINPGTNNTWSTVNKKLFIECTDNMSGSYGCINVTEITDSNNHKRYFKEVKEYNTSIKTDSNTITVTLSDAYQNETTCTLIAGGSNPYLDNQAPVITVTPTSNSTFTYSATDDLGVKGYMVTTTSTAPSINDINWQLAPSEVTIDASEAKTYYIWVKDEINISHETIKTYSVSKTEGVGTTLTLKEDDSSGEELSSLYVLEGTDIYVDATMETGYHSLVVKKNNTNINSQTVQTITANTTFSSSATVNTYTISYDANGGSGTMSAQIMTYNSSSTLTPNAYVKTGYTFTGWNTETDGSGTPYVDEQIVSNLTTINNDVIDLYAQWEFGATATITLIDYNTFSYSSASAGAYYVSTSSTAPTAGSSAASSTFALDTWTTATNTGDLVLSSGTTYYVWVKDSVTGGTVSSTYSLIAVRTIMRNEGTGTALTTKFDSSSGTEFLDNIKYVLSGTDIYAIATAGTGYSNAVVTVSAGTLTSNIVKISDDTIISSSATPNVYSVTLNNQGATTAGTTTIYEKYNNGYYSDSAATHQMTTSEYAITKPTKSTKMFGGYYDQTDCGGTQYINNSGFLTTNADSTKFTASGTLYACWIQVRAVDLCYDNTLTNVNCQEAQCMIDYLASLRFGATQYTLTYNNNGGDGCTAKSAIYNSQWGTLCTPTRTGHTFIGWNTAQDGTGTLITSQSYAVDDLTVYAQWQAEQHTVSFSANGGIGGQSADVTATYGSAMPAIDTTAPTKVGYTFQGWYDNSTYTLGTQYYTAAGVSAKNYDKTVNTTLYAGWSSNTYTMTYNNNGGSGCTSKSGTYGQTWGTLCTPTRTGYTFGGWKDSVGTVYTASSIVTGNVDVTASWTINKYTITATASTNVRSCSMTGCTNGQQCNYGTQYTITCVKNANSTASNYTYTNGESAGSYRYKVTTSYGNPSGFTCSGTTCTLTATVGTSNKTYTVTSAATSGKTSCAHRETNIKTFYYSNFKGCFSTGDGSGCDVTSSYWRTFGDYCVWGPYTGNGPDIPVKDNYGSGGINSVIFRINVTGGYASVFVQTNDPQLLRYQYQFDYTYTLYEGSSGGSSSVAAGRLNGSGQAYSIANAFYSSLRWVNSSCP